MENNETLYCFNADEYKCLRNLYTYISSKLYGVCYKHERFTKLELQTFLLKFHRCLNE